MRNGACHTTPTGLPLILTSARFFTSPRSSHTWPSFFHQSAEALMVLVYVPLPEKYLTPSSVLSFHAVSLSSVIDGGAPRSAWKFTVHGPSTVATSVSATL